MEAIKIVTGYKTITEILIVGFAKTSINMLVREVAVIDEDISTKRRQPRTFSATI